MSNKSTNLETSVVLEVLNKTHTHNIKNIMKSIAKGKWHWLLPDSWTESDSNKLLIYKLAQVLLHTRKEV